MNPNSPLQKFKLNVLFFTSSKQSKKVKLENIKKDFLLKCHICPRMQKIEVAFD